jgi:hypothetical protein
MKIKLRKLHFAPLGENMTSHLKMATVQETAMCVLRFFEAKSVIKMQSRYRTKYGRDPLSDNAIRRCLKQFQETGSVLHRKGAGRRSTWREIQYRLNILRAMLGEHVEVIWYSAVLVLYIINLLELDFHIP